MIARSARVRGSFRLVLRTSADESRNPAMTVQSLGKCEFGDRQSVHQVQLGIALAVTGFGIPSGGLKDLQSEDLQKRQGTCWLCIEARSRVTVSPSPICPAASIAPKLAPRRPGARAKAVLNSRRA